MRSILIIEDDENLSRGIAFLFEKDGFQPMLLPTWLPGEVFSVNRALIY